MNNKLTKDQERDINLLLATFRCFNEQLYLIKGAHSGILKKKFNRLINVSRIYDQEVSKWLEDSKESEIIYDELMDILTIVKKSVNER